jgi:hypothetical protein
MGQSKTVQAFQSEATAITIYVQMLFTILYFYCTYLYSRPTFLLSIKLFQFYAYSSTKPVKAFGNERKSLDFSLFYPSH